MEDSRGVVDGHVLGLDGGSEKGGRKLVVEGKEDEKGGTPSKWVQFSEASTGERRHRSMTSSTRTENLPREEHLFVCFYLHLSLIPSID